MGGSFRERDGANSGRWQGFCAAGCASFLARGTLVSPIRTDSQMNLLKTLVAAAAAGTIVMAFRDGDNARWLRPAIPEGLRGGGGDDGEDDYDARGEYGEEDFVPGEEEPVLGYDGMDRDTLIGWLREAELEPGVLRDVQRYERAHLRRQPVLDALDDLLG